MWQAIGTVLDLIGSLLRINSSSNNSKQAQQKKAKDSISNPTQPVIPVQQASNSKHQQQTTPVINPSVPKVTKPILKKPTTQTTQAIPPSLSTPKKVTFKIPQCSSSTDLNGLLAIRPQKKIDLQTKWHRERIADITNLTGYKNITDDNSGKLKFMSPNQKYTLQVSQESMLLKGTEPVDKDTCEKALLAACATYGNSLTIYSKDEKLSEQLKQTAASLGINVKIAKTPDEFNNTDKSATPKQNITDTQSVQLSDKSKINNQQVISNNTQTPPQQQTSSVTASLTPSLRMT